MSKTESKKKNVITITVVGIIIILSALALVLFAGLFPSCSAKADFKDKVDAVSSSKIDAITVFAPNAPTDMFEETEVEKVFYDTERLSSLFLRAAEKISFKESGKELSPSDYLYKIRFITDSGIFDFYIKNGGFFISESGIRHYFSPDNASAFSELQAYLDSAFEIKKP